MTKEMPDTTRVAVCGMGVVAPGAIGVAEFERHLLEGQSGVTTVDRFDTSGLKAHKAGLVRGFQGRDYIAPGKMRRMNTLSRQAVAATRMAFAECEGMVPQDPARIGVALGTTFGPVQTSVDYLKEYVEKGAALAPPQLFAESVANAPGSHIAIEFNYRGFNLTFTQRESSALAAAMFACSQIVKGTVDAAVVSGVEELNDITFSVLDKIGALAHQSDGEEACRPFDRKRNGMVAGEGAASFFLSSASGHQARYGYFSGFGLAKDSSASISNWGTGTGAVVRAMEHAISDAGLRADQIDAVWASANSSVAGDRLEARALIELFGSEIPPVVATKGYFGEYAAAGALHLATAFLALRNQTIPASLGFENGEDGLELPVSRESRALPVRHILVNSLSAGGGIICAVISRDES